jgi:beta-galactosidase
MLSHSRFVSDCYVQFQRVQLDALRPHLPEGVWVTHNFMGWFPTLDSYKLTADLDLASWDWYIGTGHHDFTVNGAPHDLTRGFKRQNFWLMETQPGSVNWSTVNNQLDAGETRLMAWHAVAHGADAILYWQWRPALGGQEQYHGSLVDQSGQPRLFYNEARWIARNFRKVGNLVLGSARVARVAIIHDYDSRWSLDWQRHHKDFDYIQHLLSYYKPLAKRNIMVDIVSRAAPLESYKMVIVPALALVDEDLAARLKAFAKRGGHIVLTIRTGVKDSENALLPARAPGPLTELAGVEVEEYYALNDDAPVKGNWFNGRARVWAERVKVTGKTSAIAARFGAVNGWLDDQAAVVVNAHGTGMVYYVACWPDDAALDLMLERFCRTASIKPPLEAPTGVEVTRRTRADKTEVYICINHTTMEQAVSLPWGAYDHLAEVEISKGTPLMLEPYGVAVLTRMD